MVDFSFSTGSWGPLAEVPFSTGVLGLLQDNITRHKIKELQKVPVLILLLSQDRRSQGRIFFETPLIRDRAD